MNAEIFFGLIKGEIDLDKVPSYDEAAVGAWFLSGDEVSLGYLSDDYEYWIIIRDINLHNPPESKYDIEFRDSSLNQVDEIPDAVGTAALKALPYTGAAMKWLLIGSGIAAVAALAYTYGRKPSYFTSARQYAGRGLVTAGERIGY